MMPESVAYLRYFGTSWLTGILYNLELALPSITIGGEDAKPSPFIRETPRVSSRATPSHKVGSLGHASLPFPLGQCRI